MTLTKAFTKGDLVSYKAHPEWNAGVIRRVEPDGRLLELSHATPQLARTT
jgi:hypothetical protein